MGKRAKSIYARLIQFLMAKLAFMGLASATTAENTEQNSSKDQTIAAMKHFEASKQSAQQSLLTKLEKYQSAANQTDAELLNLIISAQTNVVKQNTVASTDGIYLKPEQETPGGIYLKPEQETPGGIYLKPEQETPS